MRPLPVLPARPPAEVAAPRLARVSLTDRCDLACVYCRPHRHDGYVERRLDMEAWRALVGGLALAGIRRVRITGGEPLLHPELADFVRHVASIPEIEDVALTTNGTRLAALARPLREAGLARLNVSIDTLDPARFFRMTRGGRLADVLRGLDAAQAAGFSSIKLNTVVVRGENDEEIEPIVRWAWARGFVPRLLEVMRIGEGANLADRVVPGAELRARLAHLVLDEPARREPERGPAKYLRARHDPRLRVGFITGTSDTFCKGCDRMRVASDGTIRPCLAKNDGVLAGDLARDGDVVGVARAALAAWTELKPDGETFKGCTEQSAAKVSIRAIGG